MDIPTPSKSRRAGWTSVLLRVEPTLLARIDACADQAEETRSSWLRRVLVGVVEAVEEGG